MRRNNSSLVNLALIMQNEYLALHLIREDLKYHQLAMHLEKVDVHLEFFPDLATVVQELIQPGITEPQIEKWTNKYVKAMTKAEHLTWGDRETLAATSEIVLEILRP